MMKYIDKETVLKLEKAKSEIFEEVLTEFLRNKFSFDPFELSLEVFVVYDLEFHIIPEFYKEYNESKALALKYTDSYLEGENFYYYVKDVQEKASKKYNADLSLKNVLFFSEEYKEKIALYNENINIMHQIETQLATDFLFESLDALKVKNLNNSVPIELAESYYLKEYTDDLESLKNKFEDIGVDFSFPKVLQTYLISILNNSSDKMYSKLKGVLDIAINAGNYSYLSEKTAILLKDDIIRESTRHYNKILTLRYDNIFENMLYTDENLNALRLMFLATLNERGNNRLYDYFKERNNSYFKG